MGCLEVQASRFSLAAVPSVPALQDRRCTRQLRIALCGAITSILLQLGALVTRRRAHGALEVDVSLTVRGNRPVRRFKQLG